MGSKQVEKPKPPEKTQKEILREQKRNIEKSIRNIEKELKNTEKEEAKMKTEIKKLVNAGNTTTAKQVAKDIVRLKNQGAKLNQFIGQLKGVSLRIASVGAINSISEAMEETGKAISMISGKMDAGKIQMLTKQLLMEDSKLEMKSDLMGEIIDNMNKLVFE